ncbi:MAG: VWA domain-containing protein [Spirochaetes bacterium]|jgi:hypothetical protein|nr:VWA domain-containing protein [Spirochaetota bacterium]
MEGSLSEVLKAAEELILQLDGADRGEVIDFHSGVVTRRSSTEWQEEMISALGEIEVGGGTALYDALATGLDYLSAKEGMKTAIVLSDGQDENSTAYTFDELKQRLASEGVRVFPIALGEGVGIETMSRIAELSGGTFHHAATAEDVRGIYRGIISYLHSLHRMWYSSSLGSFDGSKRDVRVMVRGKDLAQTDSYRAPESPYWSHSLTVRAEDMYPARISPSGDYAVFDQHRAVVDETGRRFSQYDWEDLYDAQITEHYLCGYTHRNYGDTAESDVAAERVSWIEPGQLYRNASGKPDGEELAFDYYLMLLDLESKHVLWERGLYEGEFDEPGPGVVADTGDAAIVQDANLFMVEPNGELRFSMMWERAGKRWDRLDMSAGGTRFLGRACNDDWVALYAADGTQIWEEESRCHEKGGEVSISGNGRYFGYADLEGPHVYDAEGTLLYELSRAGDGAGAARIPASAPLDSGGSIDIANDGSFVFTIGARMYYRELESQP